MHVLPGSRRGRFANTPPQPLSVASPLNARYMGPGSEAGKTSNISVVASGIDGRNRASLSRRVIEEDAAVAHTHDVSPTDRKARKAAHKCVIASGVDPGGCSLTRSRVIKENAAVVSRGDVSP